MKAAQEPPYWQKRKDSTFSFRTTVPFRKTRNRGLRDIPYEEGGHSLDRILDAAEVVKSPGIPDSAAVIRSIREAGINIISEIEFAGRYDRAKKICITGSNGKTTTTSLIYHLLQLAGLNVGLGGNIGKSYAYQVATCDYDIYVLEISSFQLDNM